MLLSPAYYTHGLARRQRCQWLVGLLNILLFPTSLLAQTGRIEGAVVQARSRTPIVGAVVSIEGSELFSVTGNGGRYAIDGVPTGSHSVRVHAVGFQSVALSDQAVTADHTIIVNFAVRPAGEAPDVVPNPIRPSAVGAGPGVGMSVGLDRFGGSANSPIGSGLGFDGSLRYGTSLGFQLNAGLRVSNHGIAQSRQSYRVSSLYLEPRFTILTISETFAPFVGGRVSLLRETASEATAELTASGRGLGGVAGLLIRLSRQVALESGIGLGAATYGEYTFSGELTWKTCRDQIEAGSTLPASAVACADSRRGPVINCYPPYYPGGIRGDCALPEIVYPESGRSGQWLRIWLGLSVSLTAN
jgi:hypothetical protein